MGGGSLSTLVCINWALGVNPPVRRHLALALPAKCLRFCPKAGAREGSRFCALGFKAAGAERLPGFGATHPTRSEPARGFDLGLCRSMCKSSCPMHSSFKHSSGVLVLERCVI